MNYPSLSPKRVIAGAQEMLLNLDLTDKKVIIKKMTKKVITMQKKAII